MWMLQNDFNPFFFFNPCLVHVVYLCTLCLSCLNILNFYIMNCDVCTWPALRALVPFLRSSFADARLSGSFWSPARNTLAVKLLQWEGTSHRGGGSLTIWGSTWTRTVSVPFFRSRRWTSASRERGRSHLQTERVGVVACPRVATVEHVQQHAAAAPHICLGARSVASCHLWGHVGLCAREGSTCIMKSGRIWGICVFPLQNTDTKITHWWPNVKLYFWKPFFIIVILVVVFLRSHSSSFFFSDP